MAAKIHINLSAGIFEVEGEPEFVRGIYDDFKADLNKLSVNKAISHGNKMALTGSKQEDLIDFDANESANNRLDALKQKAKKAKASGKKEAYILQDIKTGLPGEKASLFEYLERYQPKSNIEKNVVFVKYLQDKHPGITISINHIYTCYSNSGQKPAGALYASVIDTGKISKGYGYIDTSNVENIRLVQKGEVLLHKLEQAAKTTKAAPNNKADIAISEPAGTLL